MALPFDPRQLNSFITIARKGSISRAAEALCIAQPALSRQVRLLEESLDVKLFARHGRGVVLTAEGELLLRRGEQLLQQLEETAEAVTAMSGEVTGQVVFGLIPSVVHALSGDIIEAFRHRFPKVLLIVEEAMSGTLQELIEKKRVNLAITYEPFQRRNLRCKPLMEEQLYLIGPANSSIGNTTKISLRRALQFPMALPGPNHSLRIMLEKAANKLELPLLLDTEVNTLPLQIDLVRRGLAHTVLPLATVLPHINRDELTACPITSPHLTRRLVLATPADKPTSLASLRLQQMVESWVGQQLARSDWPGATSAQS